MTNQYFMQWEALGGFSISTSSALWCRGSQEEDNSEKEDDYDEESYHD